METLSDQELHQIAMNHVGKDLEKKGFEFIAINSQLKKNGFGLGLNFDLEIENGVKAGILLDELKHRFS